MTPRKPAESKPARAPKASKSASSKAGARPRAGRAGGAPPQVGGDLFVGPYGDLISRADYEALVGKTAPKDEGGD